MADAINWKEHDVGLSNQVTKHSCRVFNSAIMVQQLAIAACDPLLELAHGLRPAANIEQTAAAQFPRIALIRLNWAGTIAHWLLDDVPADQVCNAALAFPETRAQLFIPEFEFAARAAQRLALLAQPGKLALAFGNTNSRLVLIQQLAKMVALRSD